MSEHKWSRAVEDEHGWMQSTCERCGSVRHRGTSSAWHRAWDYKMKCPTCGNEMLSYKPGPCVPKGEAMIRCKQCVHGDYSHGKWYCMQDDDDQPVKPPQARNCAIFALDVPVMSDSVLDRDWDETVH